MIDDFAKEYLHEGLRRTRAAMLWKLEGLSEYDVRRPLTATGTNLLGLVKHVASLETRYFGEVFGRTSPEPMIPWQNSDGEDLWAAEDETRDEIVAFYRRTWEHSDATIAALPLDAPGHVPWWPEPSVKLFAIMVHVLNDSTRHAGHADILREGLDGRAGLFEVYEEPSDEAARAAYRAKLEAVALAAGARLRA